MSDQHPRTYWTADRSTLVEEGDVRAAFLAYAEADPIPPEHLALLHGQPQATSATVTAPENAALVMPKPRKPAPVKRTIRKPKV